MSWDWLIPFVIGALIATLIFWRPILSHQNKFLRGEVVFLRGKIKEWERHSADLQRMLWERGQEGEEWKYQK
jgi:hypothetical protein